MRYAHLTANLHGKVRREKLQGRDYLVAPLSLIVPGVLNGSQGPLYYPLDEVSKNPEKWNGIPIVVDHPQRNGRFISAKSPEVLNESCIGMVLKANTKRKKLAAEAWFDVKNCLRINPQILRDVEKGRPREVSTGLHTKNEPSKGVFNGMAYSAIARSYTPDHLAILTTDQGACSLKDGCGVNVNSSGDNCGTGAGGFKPGNTCASDSGDSSRPFAEKILSTAGSLVVGGTREVKLTGRKSIIRATVSVHRPSEKSFVATLTTGFNSGHAQANKHPPVTGTSVKMIADKVESFIHSKFPKGAVTNNQNCGIGSEGFEQGNDCAKGKKRPKGTYNPGGSKMKLTLAEVEQQRKERRAKRAKFAAKMQMKNNPEAETAAREKERLERITTPSLRKTYKTLGTSEGGQKEYERRKRLKSLPPDHPEKVALRKKNRKKMVEEAKKSIGYRPRTKLTGNTDGECQCKSCRKKRKSQQGSGSIDKEPMMANKKSEKERKGLIDNLIGNCACDEAKPWTEEDRPILNALSDEKLVALNEYNEAVTNALAERDEEEEEEEVTTTNKQNDPPKEKTAKEWMAEAPPEIRSIVGNAMRRENEHRANLITTITANESNPFSKEELNTEPTEKLEKLAKAFSPKEESHSFIPPAPLYTGAAAPLGNSRAQSATDIAEFRKRNQDMVPPTVNFKEEFDKRVKQHA